MQQSAFGTPNESSSRAFWRVIRTKFPAGRFLPMAAFSPPNRTTGPFGSGDATRGKKSRAFQSPRRVIQKFVEHRTESGQRNLRIIPIFLPGARQEPLAFPSRLQSIGEWCVQGAPNRIRMDPVFIDADKAYLGGKDHLLTEGCLAQIPEALDGDRPHWQRGCDAQAWGVMEALRVWKMLGSDSPQKF